MTVYISRDNSYALEHHGVKGMKWGVRHDKRASQKHNKRISKHVEALNKSSSKARQEAKAKNEMAADLKKNGKNSRAYRYLQAHEGSDYADMYDISQHVRSLKNEAASDSARARGYDKVSSNLKKMTGASRKEIRSYAKNGRQVVDDSAEWMGQWTMMAESWQHKK